ncbi:DMT family transporter [Shinella yambaruensis]|uniref:DMT transporter permease n=1 Tax=Shinella yambaruensis TaxID=415996 RepID=A0ABQ5ZKX9_9HYPH|nr:MULTISPECIES: DMT family transporter [Shinella]MCJ8027299.1 DMT family transporter [Shinella yambaruensis]MCU7981355.1 DMT family transporter [Shinella yambaruensis]MCW5709322.1 DMT family transporter [Shinella sp.]GLR52487.1 DMT transporter permease [Shinella yambaruensis]
MMRIFSGGEAGPDLGAAVRGRESVLLCLAAMVLFAASDIVAKHLSVTFHPLQIAWFRYLVASILLAAVCLRFGRPAPSAASATQIIRGVGMAGATILLVAALSLQPVAEATALVFISPCLVTLLCVLVLKERVPAWRWVGVFGGLLGVLVILRPGFAGYNPAALFSIASAACWATALVMTRRAVVADSLATTLAYSSLTGFVLLTAALPLVFRGLSIADLALSLATAVLWLAAHVAIAFAYRRPEAQVSRLAPISYTHLLWATGFGYLVFGTIPDAMTVAGAALIIASGLVARKGGKQPA